jgi:DNA replication protein DnaC
MSDTENSLICGILQELCGEMRLPGLLRAYPGLCRQARDGGWPYEDLLRQALMAEHDSRHKSAVDRRLRDAGFGEM